jgi:hypothetical protein
LAIATAAAIALPAASSAQAGEKDPFALLRGSWSGPGLVTLHSGGRKRMKCNGYYTGKGSQLRLAIYCKGAGEEVKMRGRLSYNGGKLSGSWEERTYNAQGALAGTARGRHIKLRISGNVTGVMNVSYGERKQNVLIKISGGDLNSVSVKLSR